MAGGGAVAYHRGLETLFGRAVVGLFVEDAVEGDPEAAALVEQWIAAGILSREDVEKAKRYIRDRRDGEGVTSVTSVTSGEGEGG